MDHLFRHLAPVSTLGWAKIGAEAAQALKATLAGRRLVDFKGPLGWGAASVATGRSERLPERSDAEEAGVQARVRHLLPFVELRVPFDIRRSELAALDRGAKDFDTVPAIEAARAIAIAENQAIFSGYPAVGIRGLCEAPSDPLSRAGKAADSYPALIATALTRLRDGGVDGPYAVALSERCYTDMTDATKAGYPVLEHVRRLVDGPLVSAPGLEGAVVLSMRGGDFELTIGQDFSIGYLGHDAEHVRLYIEESFTFWNITPQAACMLATPATA